MTENKTDKHGAHAPEETTSDFRALLKHLQENPLLYLGSFAFLAVIAAAALFFRLQSDATAGADAAAYSRALEAGTPEEQAEALETLAGTTGVYAPIALYMRGEALYAAGDFDTARTAFEALRAGHPQFEFTPDAVEGLGFIAEESGNLDDALARYREVMDTWPESFPGLRQSLNIARVLENKEDLPGAIEAYRQQLDRFPGSNVALHAEAELGRLRAAQPELFEEEPAAVTPGIVEIPSVE